MKCSFTLLSLLWIMTTWSLEEWLSSFDAYSAPLYSCLYAVFVCVFSFAFGDGKCSLNRLRSGDWLSLPLYLLKLFDVFTKCFGSVFHLHSEVRSSQLVCILLNLRRDHVPEHFKSFCLLLLETKHVRAITPSPRGRRVFCIMACSNSSVVPETLRLLKMLCFFLLVPVYSWGFQIVCVLWWTPCVCSHKVLSLC